MVKVYHVAGRRGNRGTAFAVPTDRGKARPSDPHKRHRRAEHGGRGRTDPANSRLAAAHTSARQEASRTRPLLPSRTTNTASSESHRGQALVLRGAYSELLDRWTNPTCGSASRIRGTARSRPGPR